MLLMQIAAIVAVTAGLFALPVRCGWPVAASLLAAAIMLGPMSGTSLDQNLIKGFGETAGTYGLIILAAAVITAALPCPAAVAQAGQGRQGGQRRQAGLWSLLGSLSAASGSAAAALLLLAPFAGAAAGRGGKRAASAPLRALALSLAAARTLLPPNAGPVAASVILDADPAAAILLLLALAAISGAVAWGLALASRDGAGSAPPPLPVIAGTTDRAAARRADRATALPVAAALLLMCAGALAVSHWQPFGRTAWVQTWGQPVLALIAAAAAAWWLARRHRRDSGWQRHPATGLTLALHRAGWLLLVVGCAGAFAKVLQSSGVAEAAAETLLGEGGGVLLIFVTTAVIKTLQGSSWVATLMSAGLLHAVPGSLEDGMARLLAVGAICAGSAVISHANDPYFWMVTHTLRLAPLAALRLVSLGTLLQGTACAAALLILEALP
jgi:GntP family gluconate:H+ symporter